MEGTGAQLVHFFRLTHSRYATITFFSLLTSDVTPVVGDDAHSCGLKPGAQEVDAVLVGRPHLPVGRSVARPSVRLSAVAG